MVLSELLFWWGYHAKLVLRLLERELEDFPLDSNLMSEIEQSLFFTFHGGPNTSFCMEHFSPGVFISFKI